MSKPTGKLAHAYQTIAAMEARIEQLEARAAERDALARRCLWLAFVWNDHNFGPAHLEARKEAESHGITSFEAANSWLEDQNDE